jgi:hypothetical protein
MWGDSGNRFSTGSYLGEFMRLKWVGTWIQKGTERLISKEHHECLPTYKINTVGAR